jgi:hypothetical protein
VGQPRVQPVPGGGDRLPVVGGVRAGGDGGFGPAGPVGQAKLGPCRGERPSALGGRGGTGSRKTRSARSRPISWTGRSASSQASRVTS